MGAAHSVSGLCSDGYGSSSECAASSDPADHKLINLDVVDSAETISEFPEELK